MRLNKTGLFWLSVMIAATGCANSEYLNDLDPNTTSEVINGTTYASDLANQQNLYGKSGTGLSSNPATKPSSEFLGEASQDVGETVIRLSPSEKLEAFTNEVIEVEVQINEAAHKDQWDNDVEEASVPTSLRAVIVLEKNDKDANASLIWSESDAGGATLVESRSNMLVVETSSKGHIKFRIHTGTVYNDSKPMYYVNVWNANAADYAGFEVNVKHIPTKSEAGFKDGAESGKDKIVNDPSKLDSWSKDLVSELTSATMVATAELQQQVFVSAKKYLGVKVMTEGGSSTAGVPIMVPVANEAVCWKFVGHEDGNDALILDGKGNDDACGKTDSEGILQVQLQAGKYYNAQYFLNFFHAVAAPVTYDIKTFILPDTLGETGTPVGADFDGDGEPDASLKVDEFSKIEDKDISADDKGRLQLTPEASKTLIDALVKDEPALKAIVDENCYDPDGTWICKLVQDENGNWQIWTSDMCVGADGKPISVLKKNEHNLWVTDDGKDCSEKGGKVVYGEQVMSDLDGDGIKEVVTIVTEPDPASVEACKSDCKDSCETSSRSEKGMVDASYVSACVEPCVSTCSLSGDSYFTGFDTDGDGTTDVPPDPCHVDPSLAGCTKDADGNYTATSKFLCSINDGDQYQESCLYETNIEEIEDLMVRLVDTTSGEGKSGQTVNWELVGADGDKNNATFKGDVTEASSKTNDQGDTSKEMNTGTGHSITYYALVTNDKAHPKYLPVHINYNVNIPSGEGDSPSDVELKEALDTPPADMPAKDPSVGDVEFEFIGSTDIKAPIVKTLINSVRVVRHKKSDDEASVTYSGTNVYWKLVRGASSFNNAVMKSTKTESNADGVASNEFYTGTGYGSTYYLIPYHPNLVDDEGNKIASQGYFKITTENYTGSVGGPTGEPSKPACDPATDEHNCGAVCVDKNGDEHPLGSEKCNSDDVAELAIDGYVVNTKYPAGEGALCTPGFIECAKAVVAESGAADDFAEKIKSCNLGMALPDKGCLDLQIIDGDLTRTASINSKEKVRAQLVWFDGSEVVPASGRLVWTLDKGEGADGTISGERTTLDGEGIATQTLNTGSKVATYRVNVMFPNIYSCTEPGKCAMTPQSVVINTQAESVIDNKEMPGNQLNVMAKKSDSFVKRLGAQTIKEVRYYVGSGDYNTCDKTFPYGDRAASCASFNPGNFTPICDIMPDTADQTAENVNYKASIQVANPHDSMVIYAVALGENDNVLGYGCTEGVKFPIRKSLPVTCGGLADTPFDELPQECKNQVETTITMNEIPMTVTGDAYNISSVYDFGGLMLSGTKINDMLTKVAQGYISFLGSDNTPGAKIATLLKEYIINLDERDNKCVGFFCKSDDGASRVLSEVCPGEFGDMSRYEHCGCICGKFFYYSQQGVSLPLVGKITAADLANKLVDLLKNLVDGWIGSTFDEIESNVCEIFDKAQFVELQGIVSFEDADVNVNNKLKGRIDYTGLNYKALGIKTNPGFTAVTGTWKEAALVNNVDQLEMTGVSFNLAYGELIYDIIGSLLGVDNNGIIQSLIKCDKLITKDINLLVVKFSKDELLTLCQGALESGDNEIANLAETKYKTLGVVANAVGRFTMNGTSAETCKTGACEASTIVNGYMDGKGTMDGKAYNIDSLWYAYRAPITEANAPQYNYEGKTLEEFKQERSVCTRVLTEAKLKSKEEADKQLNLYCLGGNWSASSRDRNNRCKEDKCKNDDSLVVCKDNAFVSKYLKASKEEILRDALKNCKDKKCSDACVNNPEVVCTKDTDANYGVTNDFCSIKECKDKACLDNRAISVCASEGEVADACADKRAKMKEVNDDSTSTMQAKNDAAHALAECYQGLVSNVCDGHCDNPGCLANTESICNAKKVEKTLAIWTSFDNGNGYFNNKESYLPPGPSISVFDNLAHGVGVKADTGSVSSDARIVVSTEASYNNAVVKMVAGTNGEIGGLGVNILNKGKITIYPPSLSNCENYQVTLKVYSDGRDLSIVTDAGTEHIKTLDGEWTTLTSGKKGLTNGFSIESDSDDSKGGFKMLRIDDVELKGTCTEINSSVLPDKEEPEESTDPVDKDEG